jgi:hypothetical protein
MTVFHELGPVQALPHPRWYRRRGVLLAAAALIAEVGIVVSGTGEPGTEPGGTTGPSATWSANFSLIATGWIPTPEPPPPPPPAAAPPPPEPPAADPPAQAPRPAAQPTWDPPEAVAPPPPPPPPPPELVLRYDGPLTAFVSITNNDKPAVGCVYRSVAVAGLAASVNYHGPEVSFTVTGSEETTFRTGDGPATGSTWRVTVTCDNGLSTNRDVMY